MSNSGSNPESKQLYSFCVRVGGIEDSPPHNLSTASIWSTVPSPLLFRDQ
jgi:hypothetical protein